MKMIKVLVLSIGFVTQLSHADSVDLSVSTQVEMADCKVEGNDQVSYKFYACQAITTDAKKENSIEGCGTIGDYALGAFLFLRTQAKVFMSTSADTYKIVYETKTRHDRKPSETRVFRTKLSDIKNKTFNAEMFSKETVDSEWLEQKLLCTAPVEI